MKQLQMLCSIFILLTTVSCQKETNFNEASPEASFTYTSSRNLPVKVSFYNLSTPPITGTVTYMWNFMDGVISNLSDSVEHWYVLPDPSHPHIIYNVELIQYVNAIGMDTARATLDLDITGPSGQSTNSLDVTNNVAFKYNIKNAFTVTFANTSTNTTSYTWHFGDGTTSNLANPVKNFDAPGTFQVKMIAHNGELADTCRATLVFN